MEVNHPSWNASENAYSFEFTNITYTVSGKTVQDLSSVSLPDVTELPIVTQILETFLQKTKRFFVTPLQLERMKKHLRHFIKDVAELPGEGWFQPVWAPVSLKLLSSQFCLYWSVVEWKPEEMRIESDFFRPKSPAPDPEPNLRTIHIQNTMDTLVPVGDLPLSDLPPLNFGEESPEKKEVRRRIREARLKVELAKLKAKRMQQHYYERYGEEAVESSESSLESSESDFDQNLGRYSYS